MDDYDPRYEFDAPRLFDFGKLGNDDAEPDEWFDLHPEDPPGPTTDGTTILDLPSSTDDSTSSVQAPPTPSTSVSVSASDDAELQRIVKEHNAKIKAKTPVKAKKPTVEQRVAKENKVQDLNVKKPVDDSRAKETKKPKPQPVTKPTTAQPRSAKKPTIAKKDNVEPKITHVDPKETTTSTITSQTSIKNAAKEIMAVKFKKTVPRSPKFATNKRLATRPAAQTTEEQQLKEIEISRMLVKKKLEAYQKKKAETKTTETKPVLNSTRDRKVVEVRSRIQTSIMNRKKAKAAQPSATSSRVNNVAVASVKKAVAAKKKEETTKVEIKKKPAPLPRVAHLARVTKPRVPVAKRPATAVDPQQQRSDLRSAPSKLMLTEPKPFSFATDNRTRTLTSEAPIRSEPRKKVASGITKGLLRQQHGINKKNLTQQQSQTTRRAQLCARELEGKENVQVPKFKALELDETILHGPPKGIPLIHPLKLTTPMSPMLQTKSRSSNKPEPLADANLSESMKFKARPVPDMSHPFTPKPSQKSLTTPHSFEFKTSERKRKFGDSHNENSYTAFLNNVSFISMGDEEELVKKTKYEAKLTSPHSPHLHTKARATLSMRDL